MSYNLKGFLKYVSLQLKICPAINYANGTITQDDVQKLKHLMNVLLVAIFTKQAPAHLPSLHINQV